MPAVTLDCKVKYVSSKISQAISDLVDFRPDEIIQNDFWDLTNSHGN